MVLRERIVARLSARRSLPESLVTLATCYRSRAAGACLLSVLLMSPGRSLSDPGATPAARAPGPAAAALAVSVSETPDAVRLRIQASARSRPGPSRSGSRAARRSCWRATRRDVQFGRTRFVCLPPWWRRGQVPPTTPRTRS
jgi:hypothetical protein